MQTSVDDLRRQLAEKMRSRTVFSNRVYDSQPILITGRQMKSFVPDKIAHARDIARKGHERHVGVAQVFYEQAQALAGYEDDFEYSGEFKHYFPTYQDMSNEQLRGYFNWRGRVRRGDIARTSLSFAYVYMYELINCVGYDDPQEAYDALQAFGEGYEGIEPGIGRFLKIWLDDMVVYYGLAPGLLKVLPCADKDSALITLRKWREACDSELFSAICTLGGQGRKSKGLPEELQDAYEHVAAFAFRLAAKHGEGLKTPLLKRLFKEQAHERYPMFSRAVFADPLRVRTSDFAISPVDKVFCRCGQWWRERFPALRESNAWLADLLKTVEGTIASRFGVAICEEGPIKTKYLACAINNEVRDIFNERAAAKQREVHIDFDRLDGIRKSAESICEKLVVEEEELAPFDACCLPGRGCPEATYPPDVENGVAPTPGVFCDELGLTQDEAELLRALAQGSGLQGLEGERRGPATLVMESINEKLYDRFGDTVIEDLESGPALVPDYADDVRRLFK